MEEGERPYTAWDCVKGPHALHQLFCSPPPPPRLPYTEAESARQAVINTEGPLLLLPVMETYADDVACAYHGVLCLEGLFSFVGSKWLF